MNKLAEQLLNEGPVDQNAALVVSKLEAALAAAKAGNWDAVRTASFEIRVPIGKLVSASGAKGRATAQGYVREVKRSAHQALLDAGATRINSVEFSWEEATVLEIKLVIAKALPTFKSVAPATGSEDALYLLSPDKAALVQVVVRYVKVPIAGPRAKVFTGGHNGRAPEGSVFTVDVWLRNDLLDEVI